MYVTISRGVAFHKIQYLFPTETIVKCIVTLANNYTRSYRYNTPLTFPLIFPSDYLDDAGNQFNLHGPPSHGYKL